MDWIRITGFELDCILGIWPSERLREQRIRLDLALGVDTRDAAHSGRIGHTVRYDIVAEQLAEMLHFRRYQLIEMATHELCAMLFATQPAVQEIQLRIEKPQALAGRASCAAVEVTRERHDYTPQVRRDGDQTHTTFLQTRHSRLSIVAVESERELELPRSAVPRVLVLVNRGWARYGEELLDLGRGKSVNTQESIVPRLLVGAASEVFVCEEFAGTEETSK